MLFVDTSIIHYSSEGVLILCNILDLLIYSFTIKMAVKHAIEEILVSKEKFKENTDK